MCFLFVGILSHHLLGKCGYNQPLESMRNRSCLRRRFVLFRKHVNKILKSPQGIKKICQDFLIERDFHFIARAGNVK